ncbi:hypothetical protein [Granulicella tundricola]|uniref:Uncharacterized protein n=1 Tax=Granulicella tundricola (strain ATCC BAA-1859 / DSM 23138 / MP5ACTX9) TaxID=1198114 RepID=E8X2C5_GRATM|nr:hypothetical protein [Granulicella tundricola]ADW68057.1 hypothetical protein AciX9_0990 [Granulicella tundricola MP5ACTX9]
MPSSTNTFQLVLQFEAHELEDYDHLVALEDLLIERLPRGAKVDGHDMGAEEFNLFILTSNPTELFEQVKSVVSDRFPDQNFKAAYRALTSEQYIVVWPPGLQHFEIS